MSFFRVFLGPPALLALLAEELDELRRKRTIFINIMNSIDIKQEYCGNWRRRSWTLIK
jgi:hypothetical protein